MMKECRSKENLRGADEATVRARDAYSHRVRVCRAAEQISIRRLSMNAVAQYFKLRINRDEKGITTVEYAIMLILVAVALLAGATTLPSAVISVMNSIAGAL